jgi:hypothetical protein
MGAKNTAECAMALIVLVAVAVAVVPSTHALTYKYATLAVYQRWSDHVPSKLALGHHEPPGIFLYTHSFER